MKLLQCGSCDSEFSDRLQKCPKCACPSGVYLPLNIDGYEYLDEYFSVIDLGNLQLSPMEMLAVDVIDAVAQCSDDDFAFYAGKLKRTVAKGASKYEYYTGSHVYLILKALFLIVERTEKDDADYEIIMEYAVFLSLRLYSVCGQSNQLSSVVERDKASMLSFVLFVEHETCVMSILQRIPEERFSCYKSGDVCVDGHENAELEESDRGIPIVYGYHDEKRCNKGLVRINAYRALVNFFFCYYRRGVFRVPVGEELQQRCVSTEILCYKNCLKENQCLCERHSNMYGNRNNLELLYEMPIKLSCKTSVEKEWDEGVYEEMKLISGFIEMDPDVTWSDLKYNLSQDDE